MTEYTAFRIDTITLEKLRIIAAMEERSMAGQVRHMVNRELKTLDDQDLFENVVCLGGPEDKEPVEA